MSGAFFESWVFSEIYKSYLNAGKEPPIHYYRYKDQHKIDLLLMQDGTLYPIEIKKAGSPGKDAVKHFKVLGPVAENNIKIGCGSVICVANDSLPLNQVNWYVPAWLI